MAIYRVKMKGRKTPVLIKAKSAKEATDLLVEVKALTAEQMQDALADGEKLWRPGDDLPEDEAAAPQAPLAQDGDE